MCNVMTLASIYSWAGWSYPVENPAYRFSRDEARIIFIVNNLYISAYFVDPYNGWIRYVRQFPALIHKTPVLVYKTVCVIVEGRQDLALFHLVMTDTQLKEQK